MTPLDGRTVSSDRRVGYSHLKDAFDRKPEEQDSLLLRAGRGRLCLCPQALPATARAFGWTNAPDHRLPTFCSHSARLDRMARSGIAWAPCVNRSHGASCQPGSLLLARPSLNRAIRPMMGLLRPSRPGRFRRPRTASHRCLLALPGVSSGCSEPVSAHHPGRQLTVARGLPCRTRLSLPAMARSKAIIWLSRARMVAASSADQPSAS